MAEEIVVNLDNCAREPIHLAGAIQPHGLLFVLREPELTVVQVSENVDQLLGVPAERLLGHDLSRFLNPEQAEKIRFALASVDPRDNNPVELRLVNKQGEGMLDAFVHRHDGFSFLELEPATIADGAHFLNFYKIVSKLTTRLHTSDSVAALFNEATEGIREMTGFDRVMLYRFSDNYEGEVVAESRAQHADSFLGLWYPASDIPEQARKLYELNPIRNIVDVSYVPVPIVPVINPDSHHPTDLSFAGLRSVSPVHREYLTNMGVRASMSVSILLNGRLWGLVACHHLSRKFVPYELRKACTFIGQVLSSEIARREVEEESRYQARATSIEARFLELMAGAATPLLGLVSSSPNLLDLIGCDGAAVVKGNKADLLGATPGYDDLMQIVDLLKKSNLPSSFVTRSLKNHFPLTERMCATASGIIALELARDPATYVLFFRQEVVQTVVWGGNPEKPVTVADGGFRLGPRRSFEAWAEEVRGKALPWSRSEIRVANELRNLITIVAYTK